MLSKKKLKNLFLMTLEQHLQPRSGVSAGADTIVQSLNQGKLTKDEQLLVWEGVEDLKRDGLIMPDPDQKYSTVFFILTPKGQAYLAQLRKKNDLELEPIPYDFSRLISDEQLKGACIHALDEENYWHAVRNALIHLEDRVRRKAQLDDEDIGFSLMSKAFDPQNGQLLVDAAGTEEEKKGFQLITMGLMKFHRNRKGHHEGTIDGTDALKIICYVDYILSVIENSTRLHDTRN